MEGFLSREPTHSRRPSGSPLTGKYASSAYTAALKKDAKTLQKVESDLKALQSTLAGSQAGQLSALLNNPTLSVQERLKGLDAALSKQQPDTITR